MQACATGGVWISIWGDKHWGGEPSGCQTQNLVAWLDLEETWRVLAGSLGASDWKQLLLAHRCADRCAVCQRLFRGELSTKEVFGLRKCILRPSDGPRVLVQVRLRVSTVPEQPRDASKESRSQFSSDWRFGDDNRVMSEVRERLECAYWRLLSGGSDEICLISKTSQS